ncbi:serine-type D-Ala-D-Ala carboxypeptidase, partial [Acinetobacter calcoaceticus]
CLTTSSKRGPMRLISVIYGTDSVNDRANQTRTLLSWGFATFETATIQPANQVLAKANVWFGKEDEVQIGLA